MIAVSKSDADGRDDDDNDVEKEEETACTNSSTKSIIFQEISCVSKRVALQFSYVSERLN